MSRRLSLLLLWLALGVPGLCVAAPWSDCLRASTGMCFSNDRPGSNEKIRVLVVIDNLGDELFCIEYLGVTRVGRSISAPSYSFSFGCSGIGSARY